MKQKFYFPFLEDKYFLPPSLHVTESFPVYEDKYDIS